MIRSVYVSVSSDILWMSVVGGMAEFISGVFVLSKIVGYAPGAYDLFHIGHLNVLRHAKSQCDHLIAGVVSDEMLELTKGTTPFIPLTYWTFRLMIGLGLLAAAGAAAVLWATRRERAPSGRAWAWLGIMLPLLPLLLKSLRSPRQAKTLRKPPSLLRRPRSWRRRSKR